MKPKCTICNKELDINIFESATPIIYYFECKLDNNHFFAFDFNLINGNYYPKSFCYANFNNISLVFEMFFNHNNELICKINDSIQLKLITDKVLLEDISNKFINNKLTTEDISSIINRLKDLALFL